MINDNNNDAKKASEINPTFNEYAAYLAQIAFIHMNNKQMYPI